MKTHNLLTLTVAAGSLLAVTAQAGIIGSGHDFSQSMYTWNTATGNESDPKTVCGVCHTPHKAATDMGPLWNHDAGTTASWTMYSTNSPGANIHYSPAGQPNPSSLACLSCHDGTTAPNQFGPIGAPNRTGSGIGSSPLSGQYVVAPGGDLSHSHPISFKYSDAQGNVAGKNKYLYAPNNGITLVPDALSPNWDAGLNMTIQGFLLDGQGNMECSSCHDVHGQIGSAADNVNLLKIYGTKGGVGSLLCRSCHIK